MIDSALIQGNAQYMAKLEQNKKASVNSCWGDASSVFGNTGCCWESGSRERAGREGGVHLKYIQNKRKDIKKQDTKTS